MPEELPFYLPNHYDLIIHYDATTKRAPTMRTVSTAQEADQIAVAIVRDPQAYPDVERVYVFSGHYGCFLGTYYRADEVPIS